MGVAHADEEEAQRFILPLQNAVEGFGMRVIDRTFVLADVVEDEVFDIERPDPTDKDSTAFVRVCPHGLTQLVPGNLLDADEWFVDFIRDDRPVRCGRTGFPRPIRLGPFVVGGDILEIVSRRCLWSRVAGCRYVGFSLRCGIRVTVLRSQDPDVVLIGIAMTKVLMTIRWNQRRCGFGVPEGELVGCR